MRFPKLTILIALVVISLFAMTSIASADSIGQCNLTPGNAMSSASEWRQTLSQEGVLGQAEREMFSRAGFVSVDQSVGQWMKERVMMGHSHHGFSGHDFGCRNGGIFGAGNRSYGPGKGTFYVLPKKYSKSSVSTHKTKTFSKAIVIWVHIIGLPECANTFEAFAQEVIYVRHPKPKPKPRPTPHPEAEKPSTPPSPPPVKPEEPKGPICSITGTNGNYSPQEVACICSGIAQVASGVTITINCECVGINVTCEKHEEPKEPPHEPKCEPPTKGKFPNCIVPAKCEFPEVQELEPEGRRLIKVSIKGEDITYVKFTSTGGGFFENEGIPIANGEKFEQWYIAPSPEERPESGFVPYTVEVIQDNNSAELTTLCGSKIKIKEEEPRPR